MYKPVGWEDVARSPSLRRIRKEKSARDVSASAADISDQHEPLHHHEGGEPKQTVNAVRLLSEMLSDPANRICAECRVHLADTSRIYASFTVEIDEDEVDGDRKSCRMPSQRGRAAATDSDDAAEDTTAKAQRSDSGRAKDMSLAFKGNHALFAPPNNNDVSASQGRPKLSRSIEHTSASASSSSTTKSIRPPHGVFICQECSLAHIKMLDQSQGYVIKPIQSGETWVQDEIDMLLSRGGNAANRRIFEAYVPPAWEEQRPKKSSSMEQRDVWILAKYVVMGFLFPNGPLHGDEREGRFGVPASSIGNGGLSTSAHSNAGTILPNRLMDYFCVVSSSGRLDARSKASLSTSTKPSELRFEPEIVDRYPHSSYGKDSGSDLFPSHLATFVFPEGLRPRPKHLVPKLFSFVLTEETGTRVYGVALHVYDSSMPIDAFADSIGNELEGGEELPPWLSGGDGSVDCVYFPKCLVILSHHPFHDLFRTLLKHVYLISLSESPLPLERYIQNIISECPLPPQGKIAVRYHLTGDSSLTISRPPPNQLPMARMGYRGLFSVLSTGNIVAVVGVLLQEGRVALCSKSYALLTPVAEALVSLLFPFVYQGIYIPVLPYNLLDVLDAPTPFLLGLNSKYLRSVLPSSRPHGVVFVDLDEDVVHMGFEEDSDFGRPTPHLPKKSASKLKASLDEAGASAYLPPSCGIKGRMTFGHGQHMPNDSREPYAREEGAIGRGERTLFFEQVDCAFSNEHYREGISSFITEGGTISSSSEAAASSPGKPKKWKMKGAVRKSNVSSPRAAARENVASDQAANHVLETDEESNGFSAKSIREAFLRFFVSILMNYEKFISSAREDFLHDEFVADFDDEEKVFVSHLVKTQLFEQFIEERMANPHQSEVKFFDESIIQKKNRSKTAKFVKGSRETPFLLDSSYHTVETFTPPPPSNWGLTGDERYRYVAFPRLQADNFGKIRATKQWEQITRQRRVASSATLGQQQRILSGAFASAEPTLSMEVKDLQWALNYLAANPSNKTEFDEVAKAQNLVQGKGTTQIKLLSAIVSLQRIYRARKLRLRLKSEKQVSVEVREAVQETKVTFVMAAILCQRVFRGYNARKAAKSRARAFSFLRHWWNGILIRKNYLDLRAASILAQAIFRGRRTRFRHALTLRALAGIQARARGWITRRNVARLRRTRIHFYRMQLFELWRHARVSLAYRSSFWTLVHGEGFLHFALIEQELCRCWDLLNVDFTALADGKAPSTATSRYHRYLLVENQLEEARPKKDRIQHYHAKLVPVFSAEKVGIHGHVSTPSDRQKAQILHQASEHLTLERLRIYERLSGIKDKASLAKLYDALSLPLDGKLKKKGFALELWSWYELADTSAKLLFQLFPDARGASRIRSTNAPTKKAKKRFAQLSSYQEPALASREGRFVQTLIDDLTMSDLREVSIGLLSAVQQMWNKMVADNSDEDELASSAYWFERQRKAIAAGYNVPWKELEFAQMREYLYGESPAVALYRRGL